MTIIEALLTENTRISYGNRWLVGDAVQKCWRVYEHRYRARNVTIVIETQDEAEAVKVLLEG